MEFLSQNWVWIACLVGGLVCFALEILLPGASPFGIVGLALLVMGVVLVWRAFGAAAGAVALVLALMALVALAVLWYRSMQHGRLSRSPIVLEQTLAEQAVIAGDVQMGRAGTAKTALHPVGLVMFEDGAASEAVAASGFVPAGTPVRVVGAQGRRPLVEEAGTAPR